MLFWNQKWAWYFTAVMFLLNNTFIQGFHCLVGAKYLNTMTNGGLCTVGFSAIMAVISFVCSLPRTFSALARIATFSAFFTFVSVLLATIFAGIEAHPKGYPSKGEIQVLVIPAAGTTFVAGMNAFMNISYTFIGQITIPSFIAEMKEPKDFPKALWAVTIAEVILFSLVGAIIYAYTGTNYNTAPAFGSLGNELYLKVSFSFMIPTLIFLGVLYASVSARFLFFRFFGGSRHMSNHTVAGWAGWAGILAVTWVCAFIIAEVYVLQYLPYRKTYTNKTLQHPLLLRSPFPNVLPLRLLLRLHLLGRRVPPHAPRRLRHQILLRPRRAINYRSSLQCGLDSHWAAVFDCWHVRECAEHY